MNESTQSHRPSRFFSGVIVVALTFLVACGSGKRDYVLVIDTSGSMSAGNQKTIHKVRRSMESFMETVNPGDTVTLMGFDAKTRQIGTYQIHSTADRAGPVAAVQDLDARGRHTYMKSMVSSVRETVRELEGKGRNVIVVIMSDGKDDPPPGQRKNRLQLSSIQVEAGDESGFKDTYIYYVSLGKLKDPKLEAELKKLSPVVKTIERKKARSGPKKATVAGGDADAIRAASNAKETTAQGDAGTTPGGDGDEIGLAEVAEDIESRSWYDQLRSIGKIVAPVVFGILLLVWLFRKWANRHKVSGNLLYYEADVGAPSKNNYNLGKLGKNKIMVGSKIGADLRVRQSGLQHNVQLKAYRKGGEDFLKTGGKDDVLFKFMTRQQDNLISKGDKFRLGNYVFEYGDGEK